MTRNGKIARLPRAVREELNRRLEDGETGKSLVAWLNDCEDVRAVLATEFGGRAVSEQNLSEWRQGGFVDWQRHQQVKEWTRGLLEEADSLEEETGETPVSDRCAELQGVALGRLLTAALAEPADAPQRQRTILAVVRELTELRRCDHEMERLRLEQQQWDAEEAAQRKAEMEKVEQETEWARIRTRMNGQILRREYIDGQQAGTLTAEREARLRKLFSEQANWLRECGVPDLPSEVSPTESK